ncbi:MAG: serine hydrolase [Panacibacter sp.]
MKNYLYYPLTHLGALLILFFSANTYAVAQGFSPQTQAELQQVIESFQNNPDSPYVGGMSVAIKVDGLAFWQGATGYAARNVDEQNNLLPGGTPFTTDTLSRIYSVTKTFTAALVLELAKRGAFKLDEPVIKYLPLLNAYNPGLNNSVTIHQLLAHESGYSNYTDETDLQIAVAFAPTHIWTPYEMVSYVHQIAEPGTERRYSSTNYVLLGAIIESATGKPVDQFYRDGFFNRLGLGSMYLGVRESIGNRGMLASPHDSISAFNPIFLLTGQPTFPDAYTNISRFPMDAVVSLAFTGGGIVSNAADLAEWGNALFGGRATSKSTIDTMLNSISPTPDEDGDRLGYGIFATTRISDSDYFVGHDGRAPGYRSVMFYQPDRKMTIIVLTNYYKADPYSVAKALYEGLPGFICGNKKENKIQLCYKGKTICIDRTAACTLIQKGAYLGACSQSLSTAENIAIAKSPIPNQDRLSVFPNPIISSASLSFTIAQQGQATLSIYNINGKQVAKLFNEVVEKGASRQVSFNAGNLPAGIYICQLQTASGISRQKVVLTR